jgi:hypothetical protein
MNNTGSPDRRVTYKAVSAVERIRMAVAADTGCSAFETVAYLTQAELAILAQYGIHLSYVPPGDLRSKVLYTRKPSATPSASNASCWPRMLLPSSMLPASPCASCSAAPEASSD